MNKSMKAALFLLLPALTISGLISAEAKVVVFQKDYLKKGNYKDYPRADTLLSGISVAAAPGEYEPFQILARADQNISEVTVAAEDLVSGEKVISSKNIEIRIAVDQKRWHDTTHYERIPYLLFVQPTFKLTAEETSRIWLDIHVPDDASPGQYSSSVTLTASGQTLAQIPLELTVWPFQLAKITADEMSFSVMSDPVFWPRWAKDNLDFLAEAMKDMKKHGMNSLLMSSYLPPPGFQGDFMEYVDPRGSFSIHDYMTAMQESGIMDKKGKFISPIIPQHEGSPLIKDLFDKFKAEGIEFIAYGIDEPASSEKQQAQKDLYERYKTICPQIKVLTALNSLDAIDAVGDHLDLWMPMADMLSEELVKKAAEKKKALFGYECQTAPVDPLTYRHFLGFLAWKTQLKGTTIWTYYSNARQFDNQMRPMPRDTAYFDPDRQNQYDLVFLHQGQIIPSVGWIGVREGIDDYRYIVTLERCMATAEKAGLAKETETAKKLLLELNRKIRPENFTKVVAERQSRGLGVWYFDRPVPEASLATEDYHAYRRRIAEEISRLSALAGEK